MVKPLSYFLLHIVKTARVQCGHECVSAGGRGARCLASSPEGCMQPLDYVSRRRRGAPLIGRRQSVLHLLSSSFDIGTISQPVGKEGPWSRIEVEAHVVERGGEVGK
jgi:hypothetical protein